MYRDKDDDRASLHDYFEGLSFTRVFIDVNAANERCRRRTGFPAVFEKNFSDTSLMNRTWDFVSQHASVVTSLVHCFVSV